MITDLVGQPIYSDPEWHNAWNGSGVIRGVYQVEEEKDGVKTLTTMFLVEVQEGSGKILIDLEQDQFFLGTNN